MKRIIGITLFSLLVTAEPAFADCEDKAKGNVDWSGCQKMHLILRGMAMEGAKLLQADLSAKEHKLLLRLLDTLFHASEKLRTDEAGTLPRATSRTPATRRARRA